MRPISFHGFSGSALILSIISLFGLAILFTSSSREPVEVRTTSFQSASSTPTVVPQADLFSGLPYHLIGEKVTAGNYSINVSSIRTDSTSITISAGLTNNSTHPLDLSNSLKLYTPTGQSIYPQGMNDFLQPGLSLELDFNYNLPANFNPAELLDYRLLYTPFGWAGPVTMYLLVEEFPQSQPVPDHQVGAESSYNGTGDPWKMLILIYPNINVDYVENGVSKHLTATMPPADQAAMLADYMNNQPHRRTVYDYSDHTAEIEATSVVVSRPLTELAHSSDVGYWPDPGITQPELDLYAPPGKYDSVLVFWQNSDPNTGQSIPSDGWGLGYWPGDFANGMTYASIFNLSWVWPVDNCHGEVFLHEWLHGVTGFYKDHLGFPFNVDDLHGAEEAGYSADYEADGCWDLWLRDYMRGLVYENGVRKDLVPETWHSGSITTYHINGWRGEYFDNETLSGIPVLVRDDPEVNFEWMADSPHPLVPADHFSARWTKMVHFNAGDYRFDLFRDDGIRLKIDGETVLNEWSYGRGKVSATRTMTAGDHTVVIEAYEIDGWASASFEAVELHPTLTVHLAGFGAGSVTSDPPGIACGAACSHTFDSGTRITLTATAGPDSAFSGWSLEGCEGTGPCVTTIGITSELTASFDPYCPNCYSANTDWPSYRQNLSRNGRTSLIGPRTPKLAWSYDEGDFGNSSAVLGSDGTIYAGLGNQLFAFYPDEGIKWSDTAAGTIRTPALAANGTVYAASDDGKLNAFNPNGTLKWSYATGGWINASPAIASDGTVYIGSSDGKFYALWPDGHLKWSYLVGSWMNPSPAIGSDGTIYIGSSTASIYALDPHGTLKWEYPTGSYVDASPAIGADGTVYEASWDGYLYALTPDGHFKWRYNVGGSGSSAAIGSDGTIYLGSQDNYIYALNPNGSLKWRYLTGDDTSSPTVDGNGTIYVGSNDGYLYALYPAGTLKWRIQLGGSFSSDPVIGQDHTIYMVSFYGVIFAVNDSYNVFLPMILH